MDEDADEKKTKVEDEEVDDEDEVEDEEVWGPWLPAGPSGGLISGMCASLARSSSRSSFLHHHILLILKIPLR